MSNNRPPKQARSSWFLNGISANMADNLWLLDTLICWTITRENSNIKRE